MKKLLSSLTGNCSLGYYWGSNSKAYRDSLGMTEREVVQPEAIIVVKPRVTKHAVEYMRSAGSTDVESFKTGEMGLMTGELTEELAQSQTLPELTDAERIERIKALADGILGGPRGDI